MLTGDPDGGLDAELRVEDTTATDDVLLGKEVLCRNVVVGAIDGYIDGPPLGDGDGDSWFDAQSGSGSEQTPSSPTTFANGSSICASVHNLW